MQRFAGIFTFFLCFLMLAAPLRHASAKYASFIMDVNTGEIHHSVNADVKKHPASLTKIMTLYMIFDALERKKITLRTRWPVSARAARQRPSKLGLRKGSTITVKETILALVTKSANDVAVVVAEGLGKSEAKFAAMMTKKARSIGMKNTTFKNASGLHHKAQVSTARDMAKLGIRIRSDFPKYYPYFSTWKFKHKARTYYNHNKLLRYYEGTDGIKTGFTNASGFNLVASVERYGHRLMGVVFGGRTSKLRNAHMQDLLDKGFNKVLFAALRPPAKPDFTKKHSGGVRIASTGAFAGISSGAADRVYFKPKNQRNKIYTGATQVALAKTNTATKPQAKKRPTITDTTRASKKKTLSKEKNWSIQVGAFSKKTKAHQVAGRAAIEIRNINSDLNVHVSPVKTLTRKLYRARLVGLSRNEAKRSCASLKANKLNCVVIPPSASGQIASTN